MKKLSLLLLTLCLFSCSKNDSDTPDTDNAISYVSIASEAFGDAKISGNSAAVDENGVGIFWDDEDGYTLYVGEENEPPVENKRFKNQWYFTVTHSKDLEVKTYDSKGIKDINYIRGYNNDRTIYNADNVLIKISSIKNEKASGTLTGRFVQLVYEDGATEPTPHYSNFTGEFKNVKINK